MSWPVWGLPGCPQLHPSCPQLHPGALRMGAPWHQLRLLPGQALECVGALGRVCRGSSPGGTGRADSSLSPQGVAVPVLAPGWQGMCPHPPAWRVAGGSRSPGHECEARRSLGGSAGGGVESSPAGRAAATAASPAGRAESVHQNHAAATPAPLELDRAKPAGTRVKLLLSNTTAPFLF